MWKKLVNLMNLRKLNIANLENALKVKKQNKK